VNVSAPFLASGILVALSAAPLMLLPDERSAVAPGGSFTARPDVVE